MMSQTALPPARDGGASVIHRPRLAVHTTVATPSSKQSSNESS